MERTSPPPPGNCTEVPQEIQNGTAAGSACFLLGVCPQRGNHCLRDSCTLMFIAESFTIADSCTKIVKRLSVEKMNKENVVCACTRAHTHTHTQEYYSALRKKEILTLVTSWMNLEDITLRGKLQLENDICCIVLLIYGTKTFFFWTDIYTKQCVSCQGLRSARNKDRLIKRYKLLVVRGT